MPCGSFGPCPPAVLKLVVSKPTVLVMKSDRLQLMPVATDEARPLTSAGKISPCAPPSQTLHISVRLSSPLWRAWPANGTTQPVPPRAG
jgi:hypothetical protein